MAVIEDTAIDPEDMPAYVREFDEILSGHSLTAVHYGHAASGELHLRPILNLKLEDHRRLFRVIGTEIAHLTKRYGGSLSGEHGDGRLRGEFLPLMVGAKNYAFFRATKHARDPPGIFNPGKITDTPPMDASLRYEPNQAVRQFKTVLRSSEARGILRAAEQCNGSGDCRKSHLMGGTMCPSYMATRNERDTTRARASILREVLTHSTKANPFDSEMRSPPSWISASRARVASPSAHPTLTWLVSKPNGSSNATTLEVCQCARGLLAAFHALWL